MTSSRDYCGQKETERKHREQYPEQYPKPEGPPNFMVGHGHQLPEPMKIVHGDWDASCDLCIGALPCYYCHTMKDSTSGLPCPHCKNAEMEPEIKNAEDARAMTAKAVTENVMPEVKRVRWAIEKACKDGASHCTISLDRVSERVRAAVTAHLSNQGFKVTYDFHGKMEVEW